MKKTAIFVGIAFVLLTTPARAIDLSYFLLEMTTVKKEIVDILVEKKCQQYMDKLADKRFLILLQRIYYIAIIKKCKNIFTRTYLNDLNLMIFLHHINF